MNCTMSISPYDYTPCNSTWTCPSTFCCLGRQNSTELINRTALVQGFGVTEDGKQSDGLLQANVTVISNENCAQYISYNVSDNKIDRKRVKDAAPNGIVSQVMCTMGIEDPKNGNYSVRYAINLFF